MQLAPTITRDGNAVWRDERGEVVLTLFSWGDAYDNRGRHVCYIDWLSPQTGRAVANYCGKRLVLPYDFYTVALWLICALIDGTVKRG